MVYYSGLDIDLLAEMNQRAMRLEEMAEEGTLVELMEKSFLEDTAYIERVCEAEEYKTDIYLLLYRKSIPITIKQIRE